MVKYREILRLFSLGVSRRNIAYSCGCAASTVQSVITGAISKGLEWPLPKELTDTQIRQIIYPAEERDTDGRAEIDHDYIEGQLLKRGVTMTLLWNEYCDAAISRGDKPYMLTAFTDRHRRWKSQILYRCTSTGSPLIKFKLIGLVILCLCLIPTQEKS